MLIKDGSPLANISNPAAPLSGPPVNPLKSKSELTLPLDPDGGVKSKFADADPELPEPLEDDPMLFRSDYDKFKLRLLFRLAPILASKLVPAQ